MTLKEQLRADLTNAIKSGDKLVASTLRMALAAVTTEEVAGKQARELSDTDVIAVLTKESKKRREAASAYDEAGRPELADKERAEGDVLAAYLPQPLTDEQVADIIDNAIATVGAEGATGPAAMGQVMKLVQPQVAGRADGGAVATMVKERLSR